jgi:uncharacterized protein (DUF1499 family)
MRTGLTPLWIFYFPPTSEAHMKKAMGLSRTLIGTALLAAAFLVGFFAGGLERIWALLGPPDLGPVNFETLERRTTPNDALACPPDICRAKSDMAPAVYSLKPDALKAVMARVVASEPDVTAVDSTPLGDRYIQRTRWMRFPDTIVVRYIPRADEQSTVAIYSRSQLGKGDFGVNKARVARWLGKLSAEAPVARRGN